MVVKVYLPDFKADAVALYRSRLGVTIAHSAYELAIHRRVGELLGKVVSPTDGLGPSR